MTLFSTVIIFTPLFPELLSYWSLYPNDCESGCKLMVSHLIDREKATAYNLSLHVRNTATPQKESWDYVRVVVNNEQEYDPYFCRNGNCSQVVYMYENNPDVYTYFQKATDEDNNDVSLGDDEYNYVYYYIVGGDKNYFQTVNDYEEKIVLKNMPDGLDREYVEEYTLQIHATNTEGDNGDNYELPRNDTLNLIIRVGDVNDNDPDFSDDVIFTSFMQSNKVDDRISTIEANDPDLNETLTYGMLNDLRCFETDFVPDAPFRIERKDDRSVYLILNFDPKGMSQGYCNFTIHVEDSFAHTDETVVKVYVINEDYQVAMYFSNDLEEVQSKKKEIEDIYSSVYSYECTIDSIAQTQSTTGEILANKTTVYMHFIDEEKNEPVEDKIILDLSDNAETMTQLLQRLNLIGIQLDSVDTYTPNTNAKGAEEKVKELQILLGVVSLVLGLFVLLLATVYWLRTNKLERKIKVLSTNTFGSKDEGLNQMGLEMAAVPGSNYLAKEHGNHNPVFSESGGLEFKSQDTESISSGDSVLVGVEDNPEFKSYLAKGTTASSSKGFENPAYGRSIDDVSAGPPGVQGGMKGNPLLNLGVLKDCTVASAPWSWPRGPEVPKASPPRAVPREPSPKPPAIPPGLLHHRQKQGQ
ncbi:uncharacterized protein LOC126997321 isoform X3 [Eriocheir sinensis]|uniref:uncharacterized protein LOC126997321 isoform X3 n=1 Tax=Eriocheir sinensis TaxID=95602 RepID=UPI0021C85A6B|nr:uncharacterized protein LOC126997321 isoform X3 [Eriocheir sinensis]